MSLRIRPRAKLLFIGDSITDANRSKPGASEGLFDPMGRGYVTMVDALLGAVYPGHGIRVINVGMSGNTCRHLKSRWQSDVLDLKPDWLSVMIGINDVWRQFDLPRLTDQHVSPEEYADTLEELLSATRPTLEGLVLMTPYYIESNPQDAMRKRMDAYGDIVRRLAQRHEAILVDTQAAMAEALRHMHSAALAWDRVHPNQVGHMILARAFLKDVGFEWG